MPSNTTPASQPSTASPASDKFLRLRASCQARKGKRLSVSENRDAWARHRAAVQERRARASEALEEGSRWASQNAAREARLPLVVLERRAETTPEEAAGATSRAMHAHSHAIERERVKAEQEREAQQREEFLERSQRATPPAGWNQ